MSLRVCMCVAWAAWLDLLKQNKKTTKTTDNQLRLLLSVYNTTTTTKKVESNVFLLDCNFVYY